MRLGKQRHESKYLAIEDFNTNKGWSISWMCHQLGITRSAFYKWKHRIVPEQEQLNSEIAELIKSFQSYELLKKENSPNYENTRYSRFYP